MGCNFSCSSNLHKSESIKDGEKIKQDDPCYSNHDLQDIDHFIIGTSENLDQQQQEKCLAGVNILKLEKSWKNTVDLTEEPTISDDIVTKK